MQVSPDVAIELHKHAEDTFKRNEYAFKVTGFMIVYLIF
jgi:hypothetical protein